MNRINNYTNVKKGIFKDSLKFEGETVLTYKIEYPIFKGTKYQMSLNIINMYYEKQAREYKSYIENELLPQAIELYKYNKENGYPIMVYDIVSAYSITLNKECIISLYFDKYEYTGGAHGITTRSSQTWNLQACRRLKLKELVFCPPDFKSYLVRNIREQAGKNPEIYFENYRELIEETFNENSFYCTPTGIVIYYQQYDIAPYSSGIREFLVPYSKCVINPLKTCFRM